MRSPTRDAVEWSAAGQFLFIPPRRRCALPALEHRLGDDRSDALVFEGTTLRSHRYFRHAQRRFLLLESASLTTTEIRILESARPEEEFRIFLPRMRISSTPRSTGANISG